MLIPPRRRATLFEKAFISQNINFPSPLFPELSPPQLGPINNNYNREDNCISKPNKSSAMPIFIFMIAQVCTAFLQAFEVDNEFVHYGTHTNRILRKSN